MRKWEASRMMPKFLVWKQNKREKIEIGGGERWSRVTCVVVQGVHCPRIPGWAEGVETGIQPFCSSALYLTQSYICQKKEAPLSSYYKSIVWANHSPGMDLILNLLHEVLCYNQIELSIKKLGVQAWSLWKWSGLELQLLRVLSLLKPHMDDIFWESK